ncbi:MAG: hypothetical protein PHQ66_00610 [Candidatus Nanoarchaeia archaeon]|nr:hypothetical protein [Candidatus Nanoarchaeia archaeon]MDD5358521.1 hypothetical protein [Candidatus Nanoarchaeia archaeon]MDD5589035.1 hypothetical protein [Candidatus Nanoarchaeia archaeon]
MKKVMKFFSKIFGKKNKHRMRNIIFLLLAILIIAFSIGAYLYYSELHCALKGCWQSFKKCI